MMMIYHGVSKKLAAVPRERNAVRCLPGANETSAGVDNVVFPTGADDSGDGTVDIHYEMADRYIGIARMWLSQKLPGAPT
jgi:hypothetical protein